MGLDGDVRQFWVGFGRKRRLRVDANPKRIKKVRFQKYPDTFGRGLSCVRASIIVVQQEQIL